MSLNYRSDIDGLRAIAVLSVIAFHSGISFFSGGFVGVDVFFVISGFLITTLIYKEIEAGTFTFRNFYKRRAARLLPALAVTLTIVLIFGFLFYNNKTFDNLGKELFFSSFGAANILFAQGINYFAKNEAYQPLIHLWSLGVEEQFYIIWPVVLLLTFKFARKLILPVAYLLLIASFLMSLQAVEANETKGYFLLHYRAFELLIGVVTAIHLYNLKDISVSEQTKSLLSVLGLALITIPMFVLDKDSSFPGYNALWPCIGTALLIAFPTQSGLNKVLSSKGFVFVGLISYPLYLFHQPLISFIHFFEIKMSGIVMFTIVTLLSSFAAWLTYKYIETPVRKVAHSKNTKKPFIVYSSLISTIPLFAVIGLFIAKSNGFEERFKYLNPFALSVSKAHAATFHENFNRGFFVSEETQSKALFVGDSVLQQYVLPMKMALNLEQVDVVSRGGCVLLKGVNFVDRFSDISCNDIRDKLYDLNKKYDYVVISQSWASYDSAVLNFSESNDKFIRWSTLLDQTIEHFLQFSDNVIVIGAHLAVDGTSDIQPSLMISPSSLANALLEQEVKNIDELTNSDAFFANYSQKQSVTVIQPYDIFCDEVCKLSNGEWSFFSDEQHLSSASTAFVKEQLVSHLSK